jgi:UDP-N-acetylglucosamine 2-epimerase (non-hydrolysing)
MLVYGTRPEVIKMTPVAAAFRNRPQQVELSLVFAGQHRELAQELFLPLQMDPDIAFDIMRDDQTLSDLGARCLGAFGDLFRQEQPDCVLVQGDTASVLFVSLAAYFARVTIGHVEAGLRSFRKYAPFPEELMRRLTDSLADLHFAPTSTAAANLRAEGIDDASIFITGNTVVDAVRRASSVAGGYTTQLIRRWAESVPQFVVVTLHRRESFGDDLRNIVEAVAKFARANPQVYFIFPVHPNPNVRQPVKAVLEGLKNVKLVDPVGYFDMVYLLERCTVVLTDSGGIQEEAPALGKRVLVARSVTERPEGVDAGVAQLVGSNKEAIITGLEEATRGSTGVHLETTVDTPYGDGLAGERIADIVLSHLVGLERRTVDWTGPLVG